MMFEDLEEHVLELCALDKLSPPPARSIERPQWEQIDAAMQKVFANGGFVFVRVLKPESSYVSQLSMEARPNQFRIVTLTRDEDPKNELLEWWEPGEADFRGVVRFGDDEWDARTVCCDLRVAQKFFYDLYKNGNLSHELMLDMRSPWNPKPR